MDQTDRSTAAPPGQEPQIDLYIYWQMLRKRLWTVLGVFALVLGGAVAWTLRQPHVYEGSATLDIEESAPQVLGSKVEDVIDPGGNNLWYQKEFYETQYKIVTSRSVAQRVVDKLGLAEDARFLGVDKIADPEQRKKAIAKMDAVSELQSRERVEPVKESHLAILHVEDTDKDQAALLTNTLSQAYIEENADRRQEATRNAVSWLQSQVGGLKDGLEKSEVALYDYKRDNDILSMSLEDQQNTTSQKLRTLADEITKAETNRIELAAQLEQLHEIQAKGKAGEFTSDGFGPVVQSSMIQSLKETYFRQREVVAQLSERYEAKHPKILEAQAQLDSARTDLQREIDHIVDANEANYRAVVVAEGKLQRLFEQVRMEAFNINKKEIDYKKLERDSKNNQELYEVVLKRLKETDLTSLLKTNNIHLLDASIVPVIPVRPNRTKISIIAAVLGLALGLGLAFLLERLDNTFKGQTDVERVLGMSFLGVLPSISEQAISMAKGDKAFRARDLFIHTHPKSSVAECCRSIRTNLLFMSPDHPLRRLLITSSGPQEGKTTTAVSLGIAMAQSGSRVLLVDTDMRRPRLHRAFGVSNEVGLSTAVVGEASIDDCLKTTEVPNLTVLPCGPIPPNPAELIHADRFRQIAESLAQRFDRVIYDSPPLGAVADAVVLSTQVDATLLVIKAGKTTYALAHRAVAALAGVSAPVAGAILNDLDLESREYGYYYYYYRRGYYTEEQPKAAG